MLLYGGAVVKNAVSGGAVFGDGVLLGSVMLLCIHRQLHGDVQLYLVPKLWLLRLEHPKAAPRFGCWTTMLCPKLRNSYKETTHSGGKIPLEP